MSDSNKIVILSGITEPLRIITATLEPAALSFRKSLPRWGAELKLTKNNPVGAGLSRPYKQ